MKCTLMSFNTFIYLYKYCHYQDTENFRDLENSLVTLVNLLPSLASGNHCVCVCFFFTVTTAIRLD